MIEDAGPPEILSLACPRCRGSSMLPVWPTDRIVTCPACGHSETRLALDQMYAAVGCLSRPTDRQLRRYHLRRQEAAYRAVADQCLAELNAMEAP